MITWPLSSNSPQMPVNHKDDNFVTLVSPPRVEELKDIPEQGWLPRLCHCRLSENTLWSNYDITRSLKVRNFILPIAIYHVYGSESWTLWEVECSEVPECHHYRQSEEWMIPSDRGLTSLIPSMTDLLKTTRLKWAGHVLRVIQHRFLNQTLQIIYFNNQTPGRPQTRQSRWKD